MIEPEIQAALPPSGPSLLRAAAGVLVAPGPAFEALRESPPDRKRWLVPLILYILVAVAGTQLVVSLPGPAAHLQTLTEENFLPRLDEYIRTGTLTRAQADWLRLFMTPGTGQFFVIQLVGTAATAAGALALSALILWQLARTVLNRTMPYTRALEVVGLAFVVGIVERIVSTTLIAATGSLFATPGPGLLLLGQPASKTFLLLSSINLFTLWEIGVAGIGLARLCDRDAAKVLVLLYALWLLWTAAMLIPVFVS
jgi:hypothetical protein